VCFFSLYRTSKRGFLNPQLDGYLSSPTSASYYPSSLRSPSRSFLGASHPTLGGFGAAVLGSRESLKAQNAAIVTPGRRDGRWGDEVLQEALIEVLR